MSSLLPSGGLTAPPDWMSTHPGGHVLSGPPSLKTNGKGQKKPEDTVDVQMSHLLGTVKVVGGGAFSIFPPSFLPFQLWLFTPLHQ